MKQKTNMPITNIKEEWNKKMQRLNNSKITGHISGRHLILVSPKEDIYDDNEYAFLDKWITNRFTDLLEEMEGEVMKGTIVNGSDDDSYVHAQGLLDALTIIKKFKEGLK